MAKFKTKVVTDEAQVPASFFKLSTRYQTHSREHSALVHAVRSGHVPACKLVRTTGDWKTGRLFLCAASAEAFLLERFAPKPVHPTMDVSSVEELVATVPEPEDNGMTGEQAIALTARLRHLEIAIHDLTAAMQLQTEALAKSQKSEYEYGFVDPAGVWHGELPEGSA